MLGVGRRPEAKAVVMFAGQDQFFHAGVARRANDLLCVKIGRVENLFAFIPIAPFLAGECVDGEMQEAAKFSLLPRELSCARYGAVRSGWWNAGSFQE